MPELPEVETVRRSLVDHLVGSRIERVELGAFTGCIAAPSPEEFSERVADRTIVGLDRRAKYLLIQLDSGETIAIHLRMTGELTLTAPAAPSYRHHHLSFVLDSGRQLRFSDVRKFGRIRLMSPPEVDALSRALGPEPLDEGFTAAEFAARFSERTRAIKPLLLDQTFLAGVGNIYADEALFAAGIHPLRPANSLSTEEAARLLAAIRETMGGAIERGGTTLRDYRDGLGHAGTNQHALRIYHLQDSEPCPRCGGPVSRMVVGQRGTKVCPRCQPLDAAPSSDRRDQSPR